MKTRLLDGEDLLAEELANHGSAGGRLYITSRRVIFEPDMLSFRRSTEIPLNDIEDVGPRNILGFIPNGMEIRTRSGKRYWFVVWGRRRLIDMIHVCKGGAVWDEVTRGRAAGRPKPAAPPSQVTPADPAIQPGSSVEGTARPKEP